MKRYLFILLTVMLCLSVCCFSVSALSKIGSRSQEVKDIQTALKSKGYYTGSIDGIFGTGTKNAVTAFQRDNGLKVDGIAGTQTLNALGIKEGGNTSFGGYSSADYDLLARIISAEARGEPYSGQVAVGAVVLNRIEHPSFPDTLSGVVYQKGALKVYENFNDWCTSG